MTRQPVIDDRMVILVETRPKIKLLGNYLLSFSGFWSDIRSRIVLS